MIRLFHHFVGLPVIVLSLVEAIVLALSIPLGAALRFQSEELVLAQGVSIVGAGFAFMLTMQSIMAAFGLYSSDSPVNSGERIARVLASFVGGLLVLSLVFYLVPELEVGRGVFAIAWVLAMVGVFGVRSLFLRWRKVDALSRRVLVIGTGQWAKPLDGLEAPPSGRNFRIVGFVPGPEDESVIDPRRILNVGTSLHDMVKEYKINEIVIAVGEREGDMLPYQDLIECKLAGAEVTDLPTFYEREQGRLRIDWLTAGWLVFGEGFRSNRPGQFFRGAFDIALGLLLLLFTFPIMLITALAILLDDGGPILYRQSRVGLSGKPFDILKFRSMRTDAEKNSKPVWAQVGDQRITRVGRVIRRLRIDELPQVFNVLRGEMSVVGPRPERPAFVEELLDLIPYYSVRHSVKPGITGWAQVRYPYAASVEDAADKLEYDLYYVKNRSWFLDMLIGIETVGVVVWGNGVR
jgi:sugar transferase (PEP-CTERM system associated)